jgi:DNA-binding response OmpR family regulator
MHRILVVTPEPKPWVDFANTLIANREIQLAWVQTGAAALSDVIRHPPLCVVVDESLPDMSALELVRRLLTVNAMINTAVVSGLGADEFHEASEGLGILCQIKPPAGKTHAEDLFTRLQRVGVFVPRRRVPAP